MQQNWCDYLIRYFFPCSPISWGAYGGIQLTTLGLCSMIVGPCHVRASPEITVDLMRRLVINAIALVTRPIISYLQMYHSTLASVELFKITKVHEYYF